ncbi:MAG: bifunctional oligoribonuclease/PAP phosphatase NrnA [Bacteriovoracaceae bacterium]|nr:bifunctional oligoribonuclease/PAP phosphatase NrnA [Bacteriovoracaceae bacterium]
MSIVDKFKARIQGVKSVVLTTHVIPDADGIGSEISLCLALRSIGIKAICLNDEPLPQRYRYMDPDGVVSGSDEFHPETYGPVDLWIVVDTNTVDRVCPRLQPLIHAKNNVLFIDHHPAAHLKDPERHCVDTNAAATGQLTGTIIEGLGVKFDRKLALPLYTAIIIDTSSFRYPNVSASTHHLVGDLMETGITPSEAYNGIYGAKKIDHMHLLGTILSTAQATKNGDIAWIHLSKNLIKRFDSDVEDTHAFINHLLILDSIKVACMFRDDGDVLKVSLRSSGEWDVGLLARHLGGGGHSHSAATIIKKDPNESVEALIQKTVEKMEAILPTLKV